MFTVYDHRYFDNRGDELGDVWNAVGAIGASAVQLLPGIFGGGGSSAGGPARGLAAITAAVNQAISSLNQLLQRAQGGQAAAALAEAERIAAALSDPQYVYQAQRGNDAEVLNRGKQQAAAIVAQIRSLAGAAPAAGGTVPAGNVGSPAGTVPSGGVQSPAASLGGIDTSTMLLVGGGLALLLLLK